MAAGEPVASGSPWPTASSWRRPCSSRTATDPQPCLLEALPYRKDDLTSSYAESYRRLRDDYGYAVCRVDLRGTGSSAGDATDEYPLVERTDLCAVIAWLAEQEWCDGNVGMFGTSYSGFNALQVACRAAAGAQGGLRDLLQRRPVDRRRALARARAAAGRPRRLLPLHDADVRAAARAGGVAGGLDWRDGVAAPAGGQRAVGADLAAGEPGRAVLAGGLGPATRRYDRIEAATMLVAGLGRRLPQQHVPHGLGAGRRRGLRSGCWPGRGRTPTRPRRSRARGSTWTSRWWRGSTAGCAARGSHEDRADLFVRTSTRARARPGPARGLLGERTVAAVDGRARTSWSSTGRGRWTSSPTSGPRPGSTAPATCPGGCPGDQREDDARSLTWDSAPPSGAVVGQPRVRLRLSVRPLRPRRCR